MQNHDAVIVSITGPSYHFDDVRVILPDEFYEHAACERQEFFYQPAEEEDNDEAPYEDRAAQQETADQSETFH